MKDVIIMLRRKKSVQKKKQAGPISLSETLAEWYPAPNQCS